MRSAGTGHSFSTVGMLEEHGPHLPVSSDTIAVEYKARLVADV